jgi:hypothetical protein
MVNSGTAMFWASTSSQLQAILLGRRSVALMEDVAELRRGTRVYREGELILSSDHDCLNIGKI